MMSDRVFWATFYRALMMMAAAIKSRYLQDGDEAQAGEVEPIARRIGQPR